MAFSRPLFLAGLLVSAAVGVHTAQPCLYPNGTADSNYSPCNQSAENSACCNTDAAVCLSNGYCFHGGDGSTDFNLRFNRGLCTDWSSDACPHFCSDVNLGSAQEINLFQDTADGGWCCGFKYSSTSHECGFPTHGSVTPFSLPFAAVIYDRTTGATIQPDTVSNPSNGTTTTTVTATITMRAQSDSSAQAVGIGVGVSFGVLLLAAVLAIILLVRRLRQLQRASREPAQQPSTSNNAQGHDGPKYWAAQQPQGYSVSTWNQPQFQEAPFSEQTHELGTQRGASEMLASTPDNK